MRPVALIAAVFGVASFFAINHSPKVHAAPLQTMQTKHATNIQEDKVITVQQGDYLSKLATTNNTTTPRLFYKNKQISNPDLIYPGEELSIPSASENLTPRSMPGDEDSSETQDTTTEATSPEPISSSAVRSTPTVRSGGVWDSLASCESGGNWSMNTGNGYYGGLQFTLSSWEAMGGTGYPNQASRNTQIAIAEKLQAVEGWGAWPACSAQLDL